jgi:glucose dehydrogenase
MPDYTNYFWSARFFSALVQLGLGVAWLVGALLYVPQVHRPMVYSAGSTWYYVAVGCLLCLDAVLLAFRARAGLGAYALLFGAALGWTLYTFGLNLWELFPHMLALLLWGLMLFALKRRIAPTVDPYGSPIPHLRRALLQARQFLEEYS